MLPSGLSNQQVDFIMRFRNEADAALKAIGEGVDDAAGGVEKLDKNTRRAEKSTKGMAGSLVQATKALAGFLTAATSIGKGVTAFSEFELQMANVQTLLPQLPGEAIRLGAAVRDLALESGTGTAVLADGLYNVVSAFGDADAAVGQLEVSNKAAVAGLATTTDAVNLLSAVTKAYGDTSIEAQKKTSDLAFTAVKLGQTTFPALAHAIGRVTPLAKSLGVTAEEVFGSFATLTGVTGNTNEVATQLSSALAVLLRPTKELEAVYKAIGVESGKALIKQYGLVDSFVNVEKAAKALGLELPDVIAEKEALIGVLALVGPQLDTAREKFAAMNTAVGATEQAFATVSNSTSRDLSKLSAGLNELFITVGEVFAPAIREAATALSGLAQWFRTLDPQIKNIAVTLGTVVPVVYALRTALSLLGVASGPIGILISTLAVVIPLVINYFGGIKEVIKSVEEAYDKLIAILRKYRILSEDLREAGDTDLDVRAKEIQRTIDRISADITRQQDRVNRLKDSEAGGTARLEADIQRRQAILAKFRAELEKVNAERSKLAGVNTPSSINVPTDSSNAAGGVGKAAEAAALKLRNLQTLINSLKPGGKDKGAEEIKKRYSDIVNAIAAHQDELLRRTGTFADGVSAEWKRIADSQMTEFQRGQEFMKNVQQSTAEAISATSGALFDTQIFQARSWQEALSGVLVNVLNIWSDYFAKLATQQLAAAATSRSLGFVTDILNTVLNLGSPGATYAQATNPALVNAGFIPVGTANGGAFDQGIQFYERGGIFDRPTLFRRNDTGLGVMGEAGPEAIMPLERGRDGRLGVRASGSGGTVIYFTPSYMIDLGQAQGGRQNGGVTEEQARALAKRLDDDIRATTRDVIVREQRPGGLLAG